MVKWQDNNAVLVGSSAHGLQSPGTTARRVGSARAKIPIPVAIQDYNKCMGGVDQQDQHVSMYNRHHRTRKWPKTFFCWVVRTATFNAYVAAKQIAKEDSVLTKNFKNFKSTLAMELLAQAPDRQRGRRPVGTHPKWGADCAGPDLVDHQGKCALKDCTGRPKYYCSGCEVHLCAAPCFKLWHQKGLGPPAAATGAAAAGPQKKRRASG